MARSATGTGLVEIHRLTDRLSEFSSLAITTLTYRAVRLEAAPLGVRLMRRAIGTSGVRHRTGDLLKSVRSQVTTKQGNVRLWVQVRQHYAQALDKGAVIRPKRAKNLAIPTGDALIADGSSKYRSPRDVPGLRFAMAGRHKMLVDDETGRVLFWLVPQVTIKAYGYTHIALRQIEVATTRIIEREMGLALEAM